MHPLLLIAITYFTALVIDIPYLWTRHAFHTAFFANVQKSPLRVRYIPAAIVYVLFATALVYVAIQPAKSLREAAILGAVVGGIMYGFYDATNLATLRGWTWEMALVDTLWGATAGTLTASAVWYFLKK
jgi:uncharacterized membrane protein